MICDSCGFKTSINTKKCINCGHDLKPEMSGEEISSMLDRLSDRSDALTASRFESMLKWISFSLAAIFLVLCLIFSSQPMIGFFAAVFAVIAGVFAGYPNAIWELEKFRISIYANADDATPTDFWSFGRKVKYWLLFSVSIALFIISLIIQRQA